MLSCPHAGHPHGEELLKAELARQAGSSPEEVVERALKTIARDEPALSEEEKERRAPRRRCMRAFGEQHHLTLGPGERIKDLLHQGHKY